MKKVYIFYFALQIIFSFAQQKENDTVNSILEKQIQEVEIKAKKKLIERNKIILFITVLFNNVSNTA